MKLFKGTDEELTAIANWLGTMKAPKAAPEASGQTAPETKPETTGEKTDSQ